MPKVEHFLNECTNLSEISITPDLVFHAINELKPKWSADPDGYSSEFVKAIACGMSLLIAMIFSSFFESASLPCVDLGLQFWRLEPRLK